MWKARLQDVLRSATTGLSWWKRLLMRTGIGSAAVGIVGQAVALFSETGQAGEGTWSWSAMLAGLGCVLGFVVGAAVRTFLKLALIVAGVVGVALFGLSSAGWIDLPWDSLSEMTGALRGYVSERTDTLREALTSYLPSSTMTGLGLFAGATQKPRDDARERERSDEDGA